MEIFLWWLTGFLLALVARFFLVDYAPPLGRDPLTWGGVLVCGVAGVLGPIVLGPLAIWFLLWVAEHSHYKYGWKNWFSKPVFPSKK